ncbi:MAG: lipocalin/fatty-acid binding family protein [Myxococcota bacterium]
MPLFLIVAAVAASPIDGTWQLDAKASDPLDPLLEARGVGWLERKVAARMRPVLTIRSEGDGLVVTTDSSLGSHSETWVPDGVERDHTGQDGRTAKCRTAWEQEVLVVRCAAGTGGFVVRRSVVDGRLEQHLRFEPTDAEPVEVRRVFTPVP